MSTTLSPEDIAIEDISISGIGEANTISSGPDNGANNNLACGFWKSMRHGTTAKATQNFKSRIKSAPANTGDSDADILKKGVGKLNLCGHGNEGLLTTGCGQDGNQDYKTNIMSTWNEFYWGPEFEKLKGRKFAILTIWSCHTGAGESGADFLFALAKRIGKPVRGNTGWLYSNNRCKIWREKGARWQTAMPDRRPDPIASPTPHFALNPKKKKAFDGKQAITIEDNRSMILTKRMRDTSKEFLEIDIPAEFHSLILSEIAQSTEFVLPGDPLAYISHIIKLQNKKGSAVELHVYNNRMIRAGKSKTALLVPPSLRPFL